MNIIRPYYLPHFLVKQIVNVQFVYSALFLCIWFVCCVYMVLCWSMKDIKYLFKTLGKAFKRILFSVRSPQSFPVIVFSFY